MRRAHVLALGVLAVLGGCDLFGPSQGPPSEIVMSPIPASLQVGETIPTVTVTVRDRDGKELAGVTVTWTVTQGTVEPSNGSTDRHGVATTRWTVGTVAGSQTITATVGTLEAARSANVVAAPAARLVLTPGQVALHSVGDTVIVDVAGEDEYGNAVSVHPVAWSSSAPTVATVDDGRVVSRGNGTAQITATKEDLSESLTVVVAQQMAGVRVDPDDPVLVPSESLQLTLLGVDARGTPLDTTLTASWESSDPDVATVSPDGLLTAVDPGEAVITGTSGPDSDDASVSVRAGPRPTITSIAPAVLAPGDTTTITGTGFSPTAAENQVSVAAVAAQVVSATTTVLQVVLPGGAAFPCGPTANHPVVVSVDGLAASVDHPVAGATLRTLAVGESVAIHGAALGCNELTQGGTYLISVFNTSTVAAGQTAFKLRGLASALAPDALALAAAQPQQLQVHTTVPRFEPDPDAAAHGDLLQANIRLARDLAARARPAQRPDLQALTLASVPVGTTRSFRIPNLDEVDRCANYLTVTARAVFSGENAVIWEDEAAPLAGEMDSRWQQVGEEYEQIMHPILLEYFGDPLAYDAWVENPGQVNMLFSRRINDMEFFGGIQGFVYSGDFFPRSVCESSDGAAIFYGRVPTQPGTGYTEGTVPTWAWGMRATIIHEVKHIVSFAERLRAAAEANRQAVFEELWLEESTARLAEEFYARALSGYGQGDNVGFEESIQCERIVGNHPCDAIPFIMHKHFSAIYGYYKSVEGLSPVGQAVTNDATFYGSGWLLVRWAMDHSGMDEAAFSRALVDEPQLRGVANLSARTGRPFAEMLADFTLAMTTDDHPSGIAPRPELTFPGWNTRDIMQGLYDTYSGHATLGSFYNLPWPLTSRNLAFGAFDADVAGIRGGTASFFRLTGAAGDRQLLRLLSSTGGAAAPNLGMAIVRVN
jgi:hypothetical protein